MLYSRAPRRAHEPRQDHQLRGRLIAATPPSVVVLAGPNGAGKSTVGPALLRETLAVTEFVNADVIARGLSGFAPDRASLAAGRIMLQRLRELARRRESFAFETTLASRTFAPMLRRLARAGYRNHLIFLWLPTEDLAVTRVATRVRMGGHDIAEAVIRRRYRRGLQNFLSLYRSLATTWRVYDNAGTSGPRLIAAGHGRETTQVADRTTWRRIEGGFNAKR